MNVVSAVIVGWAMLLMGLSFGHASSLLYDRRNETSLEGGDKGQRCTFPKTPRTVQVRDILIGALRKTEREVDCLFNYGCWCGQRGGGKTVDNFDFCCKAHDFCEKEVLASADKCGFQRGVNEYFHKKFKYNKDTYKCAPVSEYRARKVEERRCRHANCLCDMEMVRCMKHYKDEINTDNIPYKQCDIKDEFCKPKADVVVLIQDSQDISTATVDNIKTVVRGLLTLLGSETQDYNFALATYATTRRMSCFGSASDTISYMNREYIQGSRGTQNLLKDALGEMILKQFDKRRDDRKGKDTAKILVVFSDGNAEDDNGDVMDTFWLEQSAKLLRDDHNIKIIGALIPNSQNTQRIQELKSITSEKEDAVDVAFSTRNLNGIADKLAERVTRLVICKVEYTVKVYTPDSHVNDNYSLIVRIRGEGEQKTADHVLKGATQKRKGDIQVIKSKFSGRDVGNMKRIEIIAVRKGSSSEGWTLREVKVKKGQETVTAVFGKTIPSSSQSRRYSALARRNPYANYMIEMYGPDTSAKPLFSTIRIQIIGEGQQKTKWREFFRTSITEEKQGNRFVVKVHFTDVNVDLIKSIWMWAETRHNWTLKKVKVKTESQTVTVEFNKKLLAWRETSLIGSATPSEPPTDE